MVYRKFLSLACLLFAGLYSISALAGVAVIVHPSNADSSLSSGVVKRIFLGKKSKFPGGGKVVAIDQSYDSADRGQFYQKVVGKNSAQMKSYWSKMIFSGKGVPPESVDDGAAVKDWVAGHAEGIGYIDSSLVDDSVKVVLDIQ
ncbi:MAG: phosphate ABC transporter substrate-binding protein [Gammaproteobacteria bacterium]|nr:phosphate ABC transporter substrate-binding protein [Gammaproteobacteria bacterium]